MKGLFMYYLGKKEECYEVIKKGIKHNLKSATSWNIFGLVNRCEKNFPEASKCYKAAIKLDPENVQILRDLCTLQTQMRAFDGLIESRLAMVELNPSNRTFWISLAVAYYLGRYFDKALEILDKFESSLEDEQQNALIQVELDQISEFKMKILVETKNWTGGLVYVEKLKEFSCVDKVKLLEFEALFLQKLGRLSESREIYFELLNDYNCHCLSYLKGWIECTEGEKVTSLLKLTKLIPQSLLAKQEYFKFVAADDETFFEEIKKFIQFYFQKNVPTLFSLIKEILESCSCIDKQKKQKIILDYALEYPEQGWCSHLFLACFYRHFGEYEISLKHVQESIEESDSNSIKINGILVKAKIFKAQKEFGLAAATLNEARLLNTKDRYLNTKTVKYYLLADNIEDALDVLRLFFKEEKIENLKDYIDMQPMWFTCAIVQSYFRIGKIEDALKYSLIILDHFDEINLDQFDFHAYCLRKMTLCDYVDMIQVSDLLFQNKLFLLGLEYALRSFIVLNNLEFKMENLSLKQYKPNSLTDLLKKNISKLSSEVICKKESLNLSIDDFYALIGQSLLYMSSLSNESEFKIASKTHLYFEVSWEVANKVGGIYTVLRSKAPCTVKEYGNRYCLLGIYNPASSYSYELEECNLENSNLTTAAEILRSQGIGVFCGKWLIEGSPNVILFDLSSCNLDKCNEWKYELWHKNKLSTPPNDWEINGSVIFGYLVGLFLSELVAIKSNPKIIAHFHEWLTGIGLICVKNKNLPIATIFTTHATILGRHLCAGNEDFYNQIKTINIDEEAGKRGIYHKYCLERAAAHSCDIFTSVSHITAYEAEILLKRKVDGVLPNGLNVVKSDVVHELQNLHQLNKEKIHSFVQGHFYGHVNFDMDNIIYFFTAGRYEYRNKGFDFFIEALSRLNAKLKHFNSSTIVVAFIVVPGGVKSYCVDTLKGHAVVRQLSSTVEEIQSRIGKRIFEASLRGTLIQATDLMKESEVVQIKRSINALKKESPPSVTTHNMIDDLNDPVLVHLRRTNLCNWDSDKVKIVFHPEFLSSNNPILAMEYDEFARGCHLGVFPSYYEPWGYTPAECTIMGVPSITTNLSGFGCFMEENVKNCDEYGVFVVDRRVKSCEESITQLTDYMFSFCQKTKRQRINLRNRTERLNELLDWKKLGGEYIKARRLAICKKFFPSLLEEEPELKQYIEVINFPPSPKLLTNGL